MTFSDFCASRPYLLFHSSDKPLPIGTVLHHSADRAGIVDRPGVWVTNDPDTVLSEWYGPYVHTVDTYSDRLGDHTTTEHGICLHYTVRVVNVFHISEFDPEESDD